MIQDGWGYGKSSHWGYIAKQASIDENESCPDIENHSLSVKIKYKNDPSNHNIFMKVKCKACNGKFPKTQKIVNKKFLEFYGK